MQFDSILSFKSVFAINRGFNILYLPNRSQASITTSQSQVQNLQDGLGKVTTERDNLKKELEAKTLDIQEKLKTIAQVKKIGRRYKTQFEELKGEHDKVYKNTSYLLFFYPVLISFIYWTDGGRGCF